MWGQETGVVEAFLSPVSLGVTFGLVLGKPIGVALMAFIGVKLNLGVLPPRTTLRTVIGLGFLAGIGFTVSLFITELAFRESLFADEAKLGIFVASAVAGIVGFLILRSARTPQEEFTEAADHLKDTAEAS